MKRWWNLIAAVGRAERGTSAVEFALAAPLLMALLAPVADLGMAFSQQIQVQQSAQAGAQYASSHPWNSHSVTDIANAVTSASALGGIAASPAPSQACGCPTGDAVNWVACNSTCPDGTTAGYFVVVNAKLAYKPTMPYSLLGNAVTLTAQSTVRIQ
jgi:Flp pilus assembly protein TadG